jgi:hypothetical protein
MRVTQSSILRDLPIAISKMTVQSQGVESGNAAVVDAQVITETTEASSSNQQAAVEVSIRRCVQLCSCVCHRRGQLAAPRILEETLGYLIVGYAGSLFSKVKCSQTMCANSHAQRGLRLDLKYFFPKWLLRKVFFMTLEVAEAQPTFLIAVRNVIPLNGKLYTSTHAGDVAQLKYLFDNRLAYPNDIGGMYGDTALHVGFVFRFASI